jgi:nitrogen-specific signal transduction histidine kinase/CheY-like chemotaxis protein
MKLYKVLLVDDEKEVCQNLEKQLILMGYQVVVAHSRTEANYIIKHHNIDIAVLDIMLPDGSGLQIFKDLKAKFPHIYSIIITGNAALENAITALNQGINAYLIKPFGTEVFKAAILQASKHLKLLEENYRLTEESLKIRLFFEDLLNSTSEAVLVVNLDFDIQFCNKAGEMFLKTNKEVLINRNLQSFISDGFKVLNHIYQQLMVGKKIGGYKVSLKPNDEEICDVNLSADFLYNHQKHIEGIIIGFETTTLQNELFNRILRKEKFTTITNLANALAHEIRNPINILSGRMQLLNNELGDKGYTKNFDIINRQIQRITDIIEQLSKFNTNRDDTIPEVFSFGNFLNKFLNKYNENQELLEIHYNLRPADKDILIEANRAQYEDAFKYLFSAFGSLAIGPLKIEIAGKIIKSFTPKPWLDLHFEFDKPTPLESIFEPFKLLTHSENHSSLELAIMHTIFSSYGGKISIDELPDKKTFLRLQFPVYEISDIEQHKTDKKDNVKKAR